MTPNELRIGNLVEYNGIVVKIDEILSPKPNLDARFANKTLIGLFDGASTILCTIDDISPINLDKKWLLKLGFEEYQISYFEKNGLIIYYANTGLHQYKIPYFQVLIKYVHQLQNLYFAITGKELELKP